MGMDSDKSRHSGLIAELESELATLREANSLLHSFLAVSPTGIARVSSEGKPFYSNPALQEMLGYSGEALASMTFPELTHPDDVEKDVQLFGQLISGEIKFYRMDKRYFKKDGTIVWAILTVSSFTDQFGQQQVFSMVTDISDHVALEQAFKKQNEDLQSALAEIKRLQGIIPICSYCHKIRDEEGDWHRFDVYISNNSDAKFSHGICDDCRDRALSDLTDSATAH